LPEENEEINDKPQPVCSWYPTRDLNPMPQEYKRGVLTTGPRISVIIIIIVIISCHRFSFFPGTSLEPVVNPTTQASSLSL
jgi:hypothetical protein